MSDSVEILMPGMVALPKVLGELRFENAGEAVVILALLFPGGETSETLSALPEFKEGVAHLKRRGVLKLEGSNLTLALGPMQAEEEE